MNKYLADPGPRTQSVEREGSECKKPDTCNISCLGMDNNGNKKRRLEKHTAERFMEGKKKLIGKT